MKRTIIQSLNRWKVSKPHKPLIMRGARQVGKTYLAEQFGKGFEQFVSINLEKDPDMANIFSGNLDPKRLVSLISMQARKTITPGKTLLFIDEIQESPRAITALRYFYEEMPDLHVIAAGSLLEFAIQEVGVPVGRVNFIYVYPLSFIEFLLATNRQMAAEAILNHPFPEPMETILHNQFSSYLAEYLAIGGMPEAVNTWVEKHELHACELVHQSIIQTYRNDFAKYAKHHQIKHLEVLFRNVPQQAGKKFNYVNVPGEYRKRELAPALDLLEKAGIVKPIYHSSGQGVPLGSQANYNMFKCLFLDVALAQTLLGYDLRSWFFNANDTFINKGEITEMFIGQEIQAYANPLFEKNLYYWEREVRGSQAEVDYLIDFHHQVVPVEVKSGSSKRLKSMYAFLDSHQESPYGLRFWQAPYRLDENIKSYPLYAVATLLMAQEYMESMA